MAQTIPNRKELAKEYTWNLADLFPSDDAWRAAFARMRETLAKLSDYQGRLGESAETLLAFLQLQDKLEEDGDRLCPTPSARPTRTPGIRSIRK